MSYKNLVEQQTTTTGSSSYVVSGSAVGRVAFATAYPSDATNVPYVVTDDSGNYEVGLGTWTVATLTLARTKVLDSSNAGSNVFWAAGTKRIYVDACAEMLPGVAGRHNVNAADNTVPGNTNNASEGYAIGSTWQSYNTTTLVRRCFMLHQFSGSNAIWHEVAVIQNPATSPEIIFDKVRLQGDGYIKLHSVSVDQGYVGLAVGVASAVDGATTNSSDIFATGGSAYTTDATPTKLALDNDIANDAINLNNGSVVTFEALVTARKDNGDHASWKVTCVASCDSSTVTIDLNTATSLFATAGASGWAVTCVAHSTYGVAIQATGAAASKIVWSAVITGSLVNQS